MKDWSNQLSKPTPYSTHSNPFRYGGPFQPYPGHIESGHNGKMVKMVIMAVMEWYNMATNMVVIGVYEKNRKNADHP